MPRETAQCTLTCRNRYTAGASLPARWGSLFSRADCAWRGGVVSELALAPSCHEGRERLRAEVGHAFVVAEERVATEQCIDEQLGKIEDAVLASGTSMRSLPLYRESGEANIAYVFRTPSRIWPDSAWQSVIAEGLLAHLKPDERKWLPVHYSEMTRLDLLNTEENAAVGDLAALWKPLPLDAQTKSSFVRVIEQERHRNQAFASISRQMMKMIRDLGYTPSNADRRKWLEDSGTINLLSFARLHRA